jgi:hypothetical protein
MAQTWIIPKNLWRYAALTASSENPEFPVDATRADSPQLFWRSAAAALTPNIVGDLGTALPYNFVSVRGHNLTAGSTLTIKGADDAAITTNVVSDVIPYYGGSSSAKLAATRTKRYLQALFSDAANPSNYIQAANIIIGFAVSLGREWAPGSSQGNVDESEVQKSPSGMEMLVQEYAMQDLQNKKWLGLSDAVAAYIRARDKECGIHKSFLLCLDIDAPNTSCLWVKTPSLNPVLRDGPNNHTWEPGELRETP